MRCCHHRWSARSPRTPGARSGAAPHRPVSSPDRHHRLVDHWEPQPFTRAADRQRSRQQRDRNMTSTGDMSPDQAIALTCSFVLAASARNLSDQRMPRRDLVHVRLWHIASFRCPAELGRYGGHSGLGRFAIFPGPSGSINKRGARATPPLQHICNFRFLCFVCPIRFSKGNANAAHRSGCGNSGSLAAAQPVAARQVFRGVRQCGIAARPGCDAGLA